MEETPGAMIREARRRARLSQTDLARRGGGPVGYRRLRKAIDPNLLAHEPDFPWVDMAGMRNHVAVADVALGRRPGLDVAGREVRNP